MKPVDSRPVTGQSKGRGFPLWILAIIIPAGVLLFCCAGGVSFVLLGGKKLGDVAREIEEADADGRVSIDSDVTNLKFGKWRTMHGRDGLGNEGIWLVTTVQAVGADPVEDSQFRVTRYDTAGVKLMDGFISFPKLKPGETGECQVRINDAARIVISKRHRD